MRLTRVLAAAGVLMLGAVAAGCGEDDSTSLPEASDAPSAASVDDEKAVVAVVKRYPKADSRMHETLDPDEYADVATDEWAATSVDTYRKNTTSQGNAVLGVGKVSDPRVEVSGDTASADVCYDGSRIYVVPEGTEAISPGTKIVATGNRSRSTFELVSEDGTWKVTGIKVGDEPC